jgi:hypothetical protein
MNEFSGVSVVELDQVDGGLLPLIVVGAALLVGGCIGDLEEAGEPLPVSMLFSRGRKRSRALVEQVNTLTRSLVGTNSRGRKDSLGRSGGQTP